MVAHRSLSYVFFSPSTPKRLQMRCKVGLSIYLLKSPATRTDPKEETPPRICGYICTMITNTAEIADAQQGLFVNASISSLSHRIL